MSDSQWFLTYWIRGQRLGTSLNAIDVPSNTKVVELSHHIIQRSLSALPRHDNSVTIYKIPESRPIYDDDSLEEILGNLSLSALGRPLRSTQVLSKIFATPPSQNQLHLVIDDSSLDIICWLRGSPFSDSFHVQCAKNKNHALGVLKRAIKDENASLKEIDQARLKLYKIPITLADDEIDEILGAKKTGLFLTERCDLNSIFNDVPFSQNPSIVIDWLDEQPSQLPPSTRPYIGSDAGDPITEERIKFLKHVRKESPSSSSSPSSFRSRQKGSTLIPCGRPRNPEHECEDTIPGDLLHPIFGQFVDDCRSLETTSEDNMLAAKFASTMSTLHIDEDERVRLVREVLNDYGIRLDVGSKVLNTNYIVDGSIAVKGHHYVVAEFENEMAGNKSEAYFQAIAYYLQSTRFDAKKYPRSPLPCMLLVVSGSSMIFAGATWNLRPAAQLLSAPLGLNFHSSDIWNLLNTARHMAAFRRAIKSLEQYYETIDVMEQELCKIVPPPKQLFPHKTSYQSLHRNGTIEFRYEREIVERKLIYFGIEVENGERICIKFSRFYSKEAHECMALLGCAPVLRGFERVPGGWYMSVFDALEGFETLKNHDGPFPLSVFDSISTSLDEFHSRGFVHGDIRDVNFMVSKKYATNYKFIDFDWAGREGDARYPPCVNAKEITRPEGALDGNLVLKEHDIFMLQFLHSMFKD